jgi:hypothetical protein
VKKKRLVKKLRKRPKRLQKMKKSNNRLFGLIICLIGTFKT